MVISVIFWKNDIRDRPIIRTDFTNLTNVRISEDPPIHRKIRTFTTKKIRTPHNDSRISWCRGYFPVQDLNIHLPHTHPPTHRNPNIVRICKSVQIIGRSLRGLLYFFRQTTIHHFNGFVNMCNTSILGTVTMWSPNVKEPLVKMLCHGGGTRAVAVDHTGRLV